MMGKPLPLAGLEERMRLLAGDWQADRIAGYADAS